MKDVIPNMADAMKGFTAGAQGNAPEAAPPVKARVKCPQCGKEWAEGAKFCPECGTKIEQLKENEVLCPHCGQKTPRGKFCISCGQPLANRCPGCGAELSLGAKFCLECGTKL